MNERAGRVKPCFIQNKICLDFELAASNTEIFVNFAKKTIEIIIQFLHL